MELLHIMAFVTLQGFLDAKICYFLTKSFASEDIEYDWNHSKIILHYKSKLSSVNCENDEICCRTTCCSDSSVSKAEDIIMSSDFTLGMAFGGMFLVSVCVGCCVECCRRRKIQRRRENRRRRENQRQNAAVRVVQPSIACSSQNGTVIVRTPYEDTYSGGKTLSHVPQPSSQLHGVSGTDGSFRQGTPEDVVSFGEGARLSQTPDLPPSYEDVMSQNYLINSDGKNV